MNDSRLNIPHCFGQAASFAVTCKACKSCANSIECAKKVLDRLEAINQKLDVTDLMRTTQAFLDKKGITRDRVIKTVAVTQRFAKPMSVKFDVPKEVNDLPIKAKKLVESIIKNGINIKRDIEQGVVNYGSKFRAKYMLNVQGLLIESKGRKVSREELKEALLMDRDLSCAALSNLSSTVVRALLALNVIIELDERYLCLA